MPASTSHLQGEMEQPREHHSPLTRCPAPACPGHRGHHRASPGLWLLRHTAPGRGPLGCFVAGSFPREGRRTPTCPGGCQADGFGGQSFPVLMASGQGWPNSDPGAQKVILNTQFCRPGILTLAVTLSSEPFTHRNTGRMDGHSPAQGGVLLNVFQRLQRGPLRDEPASAERRGNLGVKTAL